MFDLSVMPMVFSREPKTALVESIYLFKEGQKFNPFSCSIFCKSNGFQYGNPKLQF